MQAFGTLKTSILSGVLGSLGILSSICMPIIHMSLSRTLKYDMETVAAVLFSVCCTVCHDEEPSVIHSVLHSRGQ